jgi:hypothetical protein
VDVDLLLLLLLPLHLSCCCCGLSGVRQPLQEIGQLCRQHKVFLHTDAAQVCLGLWAFCCSVSYLCVSKRLQHSSRLSSAV